MTTFALLEKSASARSYEEVRQRRKNLKLAAGGLAGAIPGAMLGAASAVEAPSALGGKDQKSVLLRALVGALIGGGVGVGGAAVSNAISDYADLDPMVPTVGVEQRRMQKEAFAQSSLKRLLQQLRLGSKPPPVSALQSRAGTIGKVTGAKPQPGDVRINVADDIRRLAKPHGNPGETIRISPALPPIVGTRMERRTAMKPFLQESRERQGLSIDDPVKPR